MFDASFSLYSFLDNLKRNVRLCTSLTATFVMCMMAHAYSYFNSSFTMDRYQWISFVWRAHIDAVSGKWFGQYLGFLNWGTYVPWLCGLIAITYMAFSVYIICDTLNVKHSLSIWLIAGLCSTDFCVIVDHFYKPQGFLLALICACISVWFWHKDSFKLPVRVILGALFISFSLGTYGSYTPVATTVVILSCMLMLIEGSEVGYVLKRGFEYIATFLLGMGLYYLILRIFLSVQKLEMLPYNNEDRLVKGANVSEIMYYIEIAYKNAIKWYIGDYGTDNYRIMPRWMAIVMLVAAAVIMGILIWKNDRMQCNKRSYILLLCLLAIFPFSAGAIYILAFGNVHYLMKYTFVILYVGFVKLAEMVSRDRAYSDCRKVLSWIMSGILLLCTVFIIYKGILVANMSYSRLDNLYEISNGIAIRVLDRIESCPGFKGTESVYFVGDVTDSEYFKTSRYWDSDVLDILEGFPAVNKNRANTFLYYTHLIMLMKENTETNLAIDYYSPGDDSGIYTPEEDEMIIEMPLFPADGSVMKINDTIVVKFSE